MNDQDQLMAGIRDIYRKTSWLNSLKMRDRFGDFQSSEVHCIEYIAANADSNVTKLAESFTMTRGAISKMTKKLIQKGAVESYQRPDNKKEIYFRLTPRGEAVNQIHRELHQEFAQRDRVVFEQVSPEEFACMLRFVERYRTHLDAEIRKAAADGKSE